MRLKIDFIKVYLEGYYGIGIGREVMSKVIDITGTIYEGMWNLEAPFPDFKMQPFPPVPWAQGEVYLESFQMQSQTGTYLETPGHFLGYENTFLIHEVDVAELTNRDCVVLDVGPINPDNSQERKPVTLDHILNAPGSDEIKEGDAVLICAHWGAMWEHKDFVARSPYISLDAMKWLIEKKPYLIGGDFPRWELVDRPQGIFELFKNEGILLMGPSVNLDKVTKPRVKLTVLPLKIIGTCCTPCRAVIVEE